MGTIGLVQIFKNLNNSNFSAANKEYLKDCWRTKLQKFGCKIICIKKIIDKIRNYEFKILIWSFISVE